MNESDRTGMRETSPALDAHYRFILRSIPTPQRLPRSQKFLLARSDSDIAIDVLGVQIEATLT